MTRSRRGPRYGTPPTDRTRHDTHQANGRWLTPGTEFSVRGESGRFRFLYATVKADGTTWVDAIGGRKGEPAWRSFYPEQIKTVHRIARTRESYEGAAA